MKTFYKNIFIDPYINGKIHQSALMEMGLLTQRKGVISQKF